MLSSLRVFRIAEFCLKQWFYLLARYRVNVMHEFDRRGVLETLAPKILQKKTVFRQSINENIAGVNALVQGE